MSKMLTTQLTGIFNRLDQQELDIQMAAQSLIQAMGGEGHVYIKGYGDLKCFESYILTSFEKLHSSLALDDYPSFDVLDTTDRVLLFGAEYSEEMARDLEQLIADDRDVVVITNKPKEVELTDHLMHFINLSTPRPIVYTEDYDKVVQPHLMALNYVYYEIYTQMVEMMRDLDLE
ncbi:DUF2529 family protein [Staphylococcus pseudintermedius]|nr:DUF2529 domain-containing protein [Staphylococcus pseudintermedius]EJD5660649.1 DUF2529 domain-containing protein [Staphylococcus pseudintermedius]ELK4133594.1 DUF2529 domain-containing protein [Staphylococcus pseudintermedius]HAR6189585.1 DUF2529 domain-containing protein [Staphylococcus pseudintermedius]HDT8477129.1 DUF2529 domain-containing protein [Staphylococcus pseudintermedius]